MHHLPAYMQAKKMITFNFVKNILSFFLLRYHGRQTPSLHRVLESKANETTAAKFPFPSKRSPASLSSPLGLCLSIFLLPKQVVVPGSLASILSRARLPRAMPPGLFIPRCPPSPFLITSEAEHTGSTPPSSAALPAFLPACS